MKRRGVAVRGAKSGPDYIDPRFHAAACGAECMNLDAWAMTSERVVSLAIGDGFLLIEGAMGLFDGAPPDGKGATADLARILGLPVVLVVDAARIAQSVVPLVQGFMRYDADVEVAGVILNRVGSPRHERILRNALEQAGISVLGALYRDAGLQHPSRHLGLVQAQEREDLEEFIEGVADLVMNRVDVDDLVACAMPLPASKRDFSRSPPAQRIAIADDAAFAFAYPHLLSDWRASGAEISFFSPLADQAPPDADLIILPGGYPELHAGQISSNATFLNELRKASESSVIYGECGGFMVLGSALIDKYGVGHDMAGLLQLETSFAERKLHLGYRDLIASKGPFAGAWKGHEFHYAKTIHARGEPLFEAWDAEGNALAPMGLIEGNVSGSFAHLIDRADPLWHRGIRPIVWQLQTPQSMTAAPDAT